MLPEWELNMYKRPDSHFSFAGHQTKEYLHSTVSVHFQHPQIALHLFVRYQGVKPPPIAGQVVHTIISGVPVHLVAELKKLTLIIYIFSYRIF